MLTQKLIMKSVLQTPAICKLYYLIINYVAL